MLARCRPGELMEIIKRPTEPSLGKFEARAFPLTEPVDNDLKNCSGGHYGPNHAALICGINTWLALDPYLHTARESASH